MADSHLTQRMLNYYKRLLKTVDEHDGRRYNVSNMVAERGGDQTSTLGLTSSLLQSISKLNPQVQYAAAPVQYMEAPLV